MLEQEQRDRLPGWLLKLLDSDNVDDIGYAERNCSTRHYIQLLAARRRELEQQAWVAAKLRIDEILVAAWAYKVGTDEYNALEFELRALRRQIDGYVAEGLEYPS